MSCEKKDEMGKENGNEGSEEAPGGTEDHRIKELEEQARKLRLELDDARSATAVAECVKESMVELERQKNSLEEEMATMQQLLNEAHDEAAAVRTGYEHQLAKSKAVIDQLERENQEIKIQLKVGPGGAAGMGGASGDSVIDRETILGGAAVISDATKSFARRMKSNLLQTGVMQDKAGAAVTSPSSGPVGSGAARAPSPQSNHLEEGMRRAHEDTELLKSIVVPLEEQIGALKDKLRETDGLLRQHEERQSQSLLAVEGMARWLEGRPVEEAMGELLRLSGSEDLAAGKERAQESAYISLMSTRYSLLISELASVRREHAEVVELLDRERMVVKRLKRESVISSSEMMRAQREHLAEVTRMQALLTEDQKDQLLRQGSTSSEPRAAAAGAASPLKSPAESVSSHTSSDSCPSTPAGRAAGGESDDEAAVTRIVSSVEWESMQKELNKVRALLGVGAGDSVVGSDQYRALQADLIELKKQKAGLAKTVEKMKEEAREEDGHRRQLEDKWNEKAEGHRVETEALNRQVQELEGLLEQVRMSYSTVYEACRKDLQRLTTDREKIVRELKRLQDETEVLTGKHSATARDMQAEAINLPEGTEEMQLMLLRLREDTIAAKVAKERAEEKARAEVGFLRDQLRGEEEAKRSVEDQFTAEIDSLKASLSKLQGCQAELQGERQKRREAETREQECRAEALRARGETQAVATEKRDLEARLGEVRGRASNLQQELDNSVAVQNDFVRLSQSLQVELEKIRQSEKEVRWQHEDDVSECGGCRAALAPSRSPSSSAAGGGRNKHHCRHCGRIFCSDCVSKHVPSGPRQRPAKVCDVCHTLLVQNSAPYFSTEAPQGNN